MGKKNKKDNELVQIPRPYNNSAIGSWAGYIYQGLCAVHVSLHMILKSLNEDKSDRRFLTNRIYLDAFEDFSIHDGSNKAISLHQCKLYKDKKNFNEAIDQLVKQNDYLLDDEISSDKTKLYFHSNHRVDIDSSKNVERYKGDSKEETWDALEIVEEITKIVKKLTAQLNLPKPIKTTTCLLFDLINGTVLTNHKKFCEEKIELRVLVRRKESSISFEDIWKILRSEMVVDCDELEIAHIMRYYFIQNLSFVIAEYEEDNDWEGLLEENIVTATSMLKQLDPMAMLLTIKRIHPEHFFENSHNDIVNNANDRSVQDLIELIGATSHAIREKIDWHIRGSHISPAIFRTNSIHKSIRNLFKNRHNLDCLREYRWLVGRHIPESVPDISVFDEDITKNIDGADDTSNSIFSEKKIGLLAFEDFKNDKI